MLDDLAIFSSDTEKLLIKTDSETTEDSDSSDSSSSNYVDSPESKSSSSESSAHLDSDTTPRHKNCQCMLHADAKVV